MASDWVAEEGWPEWVSLDKATKEGREVGSAFQATKR